ncbi:MAG: zinc-binding dehydrogenase [Isosphaeraceae bacterium]|nr:zinc-binding dehydrogenase [Isosphaeraceae bacterium]
MSSTRAIVFHGPGEPLVLREFRRCEAPAGGLLARVAACTLCGSDLHSVEGRRTVAVPTILGHEILGVVEAFGEGAARTDAAGDELREGDRITWAIVAACGACVFCERGLPQKCEYQTKYGHERIRPGLELTGGLADRVQLVPGTAIFRVPEHLPDEVACPANCATATVAAAFEAAGPVEGRDVLILGAGMLGITAVACARASGARTVIACDRDAARAETAARFGADAVASPETLTETIARTTSGRGIDAAIELTGAPESFEAALAAARVGGSIVLVGSVFPSRPVEVAPERVVRGCLTIRGVHNYAPRHLKQAIDFLARADVDRFKTLVGPWRPLTSLAGSSAIPPAAVGLRLGIRPFV